MKISILCFSLILLVGCSDNSADKMDAPEALRTFSGIQPIAFLAEQVGGKYVKTQAVVPPGKDPHSFSPTPADIKELQQAKLFFSVQLPFEHNVLDKLLKDTKIEIVDVSHGVKRIKISGDEHHHRAGHDHGAEHRSYENFTDPHIWLSPGNAIIIADNIRNALSRAMPKRAAYFNANCNRLTASIRKLDQRLAAALKPYNGKTFFVYHPAFGYFAARYGLTQEAVESQGKSPSPRQLEKLIKAAKKDKVKIIFVQPQFNRKMAAIVARAIGGQVVPLDPLAYNLIKNFSMLANALGNAIQTEKR